MKRKNITLITGTEGTRRSLVEQLEPYVVDFAHLESCTIDEGIDKTIKADLVVISTELIYDDAIVHIEDKCPIIVARRVLNYSEIEKLLSIPSGEEVLFVNDCEETTSECIDWLKKLGIDNYRYIPFYPGYTPKEKPKIAITPGEASLVPSFVDEVIDIGPRLIDITTLTEILKELNLFEEKWDQISTIYLNKIIDMGKALTEINKEKSENFNHVVKVIDSLNEGILVFNESQVITVFNENLKYLLGLRRPHLMGRRLKEVITNKELQAFILKQGKEETAIIVIKGEEVAVTRFSLKEDNSTVVIFKKAAGVEGEDNERQELYKKGFIAKYAFSDIIGLSTSMVQTKSIARKLAATDLTVLIEGESGTGKELFASAIHNASARKNKPFVAVNFSSLSETLVESELFGYEEGAFTGAIKGGKPGLFQQAEGGTIFLDEIGDISPRVQSRLLRVLQEKEIMPVGGNKIIPVDVRVIAATNQSLYEMVEKKSFRADLYHRLKVLYLKLPSLRQRKEDILPLVEEFLREKNMEHLIIEEAVKKKLISYDWMGNVRELKNTIDYMTAVCQGNTISLEDLPQESFFHLEEKAGEKQLEIEACGDLMFILRALYHMNERGERGSRARLLSEARQQGMALTEQMIRNRLQQLETFGYVSKNLGRGGTSLTAEGLKKIRDII